MHLAILVSNHVVLALSLQTLSFAAKVVTTSRLRCTRFFKLATVGVSNSLPSGTEEPFHTVKVGWVGGIL